MGTSGYKEKKHIEYANIPEELKNIRNNHYSCLDCNLMPEIININDKTGMIELNCTKHNKKELKIENYLKNQFSNFHYENDNNYDNNDNFNRNQLNYSNESRIIENNDRNNLMDKMKIIENKRNRLIRIKEFNENYIKLLDIILEIYEKKPLNYMNNINIKNIAKIINYIFLFIIF